MARGRMINNAITEDKRINDLSDDTSRLAFTWLITFADCEGRVAGDPAIVRSKLFPRREDISAARMEQYIREWAALGLIIWYESGGDKWIYFPAFERNQPGLNKTKEAKSRVPAPPQEQARLADNSGVTPELLQSKGGATPSEGNLNQNLTEEKRTVNGAAAPPAPPPDAKKKHQSPETRQRNAVRSALQEYFCAKTSLPPPKAETQAQKRSAGKLWWSPLWEIAELAGWHLPAGQRLIDDALGRLDGLTVSDPNSILKTARAMHANPNSNSRGSPPGSNNVADLLRWAQKGQVIDGNAH